MVRFGADDILRTDDTGVTDQDIDALLAKGEKRTEEVRISNNASVCALDIFEFM